MSVHKANHTRSTIADTIIHEMNDDDNQTCKWILRDITMAEKDFV